MAEQTNYLYRGEKIDNIKSKIEKAKIETDKLENGLIHGNIVLLLKMK